MMTQFLPNSRTKTALVATDKPRKCAVLELTDHTDAKGDDAYNQTLSERRADGVRRFLVEKFSLAAENLVPIGYGKTQLKNAADPFAGENRRVQIVNTEMK